MVRPVLDARRPHTSAENATFAAAALEGTIAQPITDPQQLASGFGSDSEPLDGPTLPGPAHGHLGEPGRGPLLDELPATRRPTTST
ncbi:unnamed protein product [Lampetra planeri]